MKMIKFLPLSALLALCLSACTATTLEGEWKMENTPENITATVFLKPNGELAGSTGLNHYFGSYIASEEGAVILDPKGMTRMAGAPEDMEFETKFLEIIRHADSYVIEKDKLILKAGNETLAVFEKTNCTAEVQ